MSKKVLNLSLMETSRYQNGGIKNEEREHITGSTGTNDKMLLVNVD